MHVRAGAICDEHLDVTGTEVGPSKIALTCPIQNRILASSLMLNLVQDPKKVCGGSTFLASGNVSLNGTQGVLFMHNRNPVALSPGSYMHVGCEPGTRIPNPAELDAKVRSPFTLEMWVSLDKISSENSEIRSEHLENARNSF